MSVIYGVLIVGGACLAAVVGLTVVQRLVPLEVRQRHNDVTPRPGICRAPPSN
jgi:hypothetical protein